MTEHITQLRIIHQIRDCTGPWGTLLLLAAELHQEYCFHIDKFVWRLCVSYHQLNSVTRSFEFPIPRCSDSIKYLGYLFRSLFFISLDARSDIIKFKYGHVIRKSQFSLLLTVNINALLLYLLGRKMILFLHRHDEGSLK